MDHSQFITDVTDDSFDAEVKKQPGFVLVDVWADWCTPCHALAPHIDTIANKLKGNLKVTKLDADNNQRTAIEFQVMSLPTMLLLKDGVLVGQAVGFRPAPTIMEWLEEKGVDTPPAPAAATAPVAPGGMERRK